MKVSQAISCTPSCVSAGEEGRGRRREGGRGRGRRMWERGRRKGRRKKRETERRGRRRKRVTEVTHTIGTNIGNGT